MGPWQYGSASQSAHLQHKVIVQNNTIKTQGQTTFNPDFPSVIGKLFKYAFIKDS